MPSSVTERIEAADDMDQEGESSTDSTRNLAALHTPGPGSSVSQAPRTSLKKSRAKTSHIHKYISTQGENFVCNRCSKIYKTSGGTGAIARHLKKAHSIEPTAGGTGKERVTERATTDAAMLPGAGLDAKAGTKTREEVMGIGLDKNTLIDLYLRWTLSLDIPLSHVEDKAFRTFLEYINPAANRMLPSHESIMKIHAERLLAEGKPALEDDDTRTLSRPTR